VLHEVTATLLAWRVLAPGLAEPVVALQAPAEADASTGTNAGELLTLGIAKSVVAFPRAGTETAETRNAVTELLGAIR
jgi:dethiobiotin synthetase